MHAGPQQGMRIMLADISFAVRIPVVPPNVESPKPLPPLLLPPLQLLGEQLLMGTLW